MATHIDKNSIKHFFVGFLPSLVGGLYGVSASVGASFTREYDNSHEKGTTSVGGTCSLTSSDV